MTIPDRKAEIRKRVEQEENERCPNDLTRAWYNGAKRDRSELLSMLDAVESERDQLKRRVAELEDGTGHTYVLSPDEMRQINDVLRFKVTQDECDLIEGVLRKARVKWYVQWHESALSTPAQVPATKEV